MHNISGGRSDIIGSVLPDGVIRNLSSPTVYYYSLQDAYNAAANGDVIQFQDYPFIQNLGVNRNISVSMEGGYDSGFTAATGNTSMKGKLQTYPNGGTVTIKNFILENNDSPPPVTAESIRIVGVPSPYFSVLQDAYNAASNGNIIQVKYQELIQNLDVNRDISVTMEGGYNFDFTTTTGSTSLKGKIQTYPNGGRLTIKNFILENN
ncbi:MAG: hypothetical protein KJ826_03125 [Proteobacteria bacterium]|nr:hypothetical protein [Pseudomonadota bacterium]MBU4036173.1 hypothetical protein [Pseudomonadota bacterium]